MSYRIAYNFEKMQVRRDPEKRKNLSAFAVGLLIVAAVPSFLFPNQMQQLREQMFPWAQPAVQEAFGTFCSDVKEGESFQDAAAAFCREILYDTETSD